MNKNINMDRVVNAIEKLEAINGEPEYIVLKKANCFFAKRTNYFQRRNETKA